MIENIQRSFVFLGLVALLSTIEAPNILIPARAQQSQPHEHAGKGPHGGALQDIAGYLGELVVGGGKVVLYVMDHDLRRSVATQGMKANVVFVRGSARKGALALHSNEGRLEGAGRVPSRADAVVTLILADGKTDAARFERGG